MAAVFVVGAGPGIGRSVARRFAAAGHPVGDPAGRGTGAAGEPGARRGRARHHLITVGRCCGQG